MKILVTGHRGFIGSQIYSYFKSHHEVVGYDYDPNVVPDIRGYDWVIHCGAISSTTERDIDLVLRQNLEFSQRLLEDCHRYGVNLQYSSSASIYGLGTDFRETAPPDPRTPYAWSKYLFERYVAQNPGPSIVQGFRYFNVYGEPEQEAHKGGQASPYTQFRLQARRYGRISLFTNSESYWRDFVPIERVVGVHKRFLAIPESGLWNIGTGQVRSFAQVADEVVAETGCAVDYIAMPKQLEHSYQTYTCADLTHLHKTLEKYDVMD
jgi:ADP-L-glycero-D-manno-heptose 6-epimerase